MARTKSSSSGDVGEPEETTDTQPEETTTSGADSTSQQDQPPAVVTSPAGDTRPLVEEPPAVVVPDGMEEVVIASPQSQPERPAVAKTTADKPFLLRIGAPYDAFRVPGQGDPIPEGGGARADLMLTTTYKPVTQTQLEAARVATRGTGIKLIAARPKKEA